jgi:hypothetical protein
MRKGRYGAGTARGRNGGCKMIETPARRADTASSLLLEISVEIGMFNVRVPAHP